MGKVWLPLRFQEKEARSKNGIYASEMNGFSSANQALIFDFFCFFIFGAGIGLIYHKITINK